MFATWDMYAAMGEYLAFEQIKTAFRKRYPDLGGKLVHREPVGGAALPQGSVSIRR